MSDKVTYLDLLGNFLTTNKYKKMEQVKDHVLLKDIIIPAGTVLRQAPTKTVRSSKCVEAIIGLSDNTTQFFYIYVDDEDMEEISDYVSELK